MDSAEIHPSISARMAQAVQADERLKKRCFACQSPDHFIRECSMTKNGKRPLPPEGASKKQFGFSWWKGKDTALYAHSPSAAAYVTSTDVDVKGWGGARPKVGKRAPYLNPDPFKRFIGPKNWGEALIDGELTTCLLDNGAQVNFVTPRFAVERGLNVMSPRLPRRGGGREPASHQWSGGKICETRRVCHGERPGSLCKGLQ